MIWENSSRWPFSCRRDVAGRVIVSGTLSFFFPLFFDRERLILLRVEFYTQAPFSLPWCQGPWLLYCLLFSPQLLCLPFQLFVYKFVCSQSILSVLKCTWFFLIFLHHCLLGILIWWLTTESHQRSCYILETVLSFSPLQQSIWLIAFKFNLT